MQKVVPTYDLNQKNLNFFFCCSGEFPPNVTQKELKNNLKLKIKNFKTYKAKQKARHSHKNFNFEMRVLGIKTNSKACYEFVE